MSQFVIDPAAAVGPVALTVADLRRAEQFYCEVLGLRVLAHGDATLELTADGAQPLVLLAERPGAHHKPARATGLYHFALLMPTRLDLARSLRRLAELRYPLSGASDHLVSEALYLDDPDGNGIELYRDRPREQWPRSNHQLRMAVDPLDFDGLLGELEHDTRPWEGVAAGTTLGHMHLHVADLRAAEAFYCGVLGFEVMLRYGPSALFIAAGGYHHHIGLNTWAGVGAPPPPPEAAGLRHFAVRLPNTAARDAVLARVREVSIALEETPAGWLLHDPSSNGVLLT